MTQPGVLVAEAPPVKVKRPDPMNVANALTVFRIVAVPAILYLMVADWGPPGLAGDYGKVYAFFLTLAAAITDFFDGAIARWYGQETKLGKFLDPVADKLLVCSVFTVFVATGDIAPWVLIAMFWREFLVLGLRMVLASEGTVLGASEWAKFKTIFQIAGAVTLLMVKALQVLAISGDVVVHWVTMVYFVHIAQALVNVSVLLSVMSGLEYFLLNWELLKRG